MLIFCKSCGQNLNAISGVRFGWGESVSSFFSFSGTDVSKIEMLKSSELIFERLGELKHRIGSENNCKVHFSTPNSLNTKKAHFFRMENTNFSSKVSIFPTSARKPPPPQLLPPLWSLAVAPLVP